MNPALSLVFFASGAAALLFETLWFRQVGLMLGNSVWATSLVTSSFMGGLALGNLLAARRGAGLRRPVLAYAALEATIGATGLALVLGLPHLTPLVASLLAPLVTHPSWLNAVRFALAFALLLVPASAMGATLPVLASALSTRNPRFSRVLGSLYGWNTLGAVVGALAGEGLLIERLGMRGTGLCATALDLACGAAALALSRHTEARPPGGAAPEGGRAAAVDGRRRLFAAAALAGGILLALELIWFRLLLLFVFGTSLAFAVMLAVVLAGIGIGGLATGRVGPTAGGARRVLAALALAAGAVTTWTYSALSDVLAVYQHRYLDRPGEVLAVAAALMLPTAVCSGALFTLMGTALQGQRHEAAGVTGRLTLANTLGATFGPLLAAFVLLPRIGVERSVFGLAAAYGGLAVLTVRPRELRAAGDRRSALALGLAGAAFVALLASFPFGLMRNHYVPLMVRSYLTADTRIEAQREGLTETVTYLGRQLWGQPVSHRLVTNGHSMSSSQFSSGRYMRLFVYWPVALHPRPRRALLISYGVGLTAKSLTDTAALESIDVVDISRDILELGRVVFPDTGAAPLDDPRVRAHVEDGRFFLQTTRQVYDIITAEPPPPKAAGIVNLYSREYFGLVRERLAPGGLATYWLPVYQMEARESKAIVRAFCDVFADCSLWNGMGFEWMLAGTREARGPVDAATFARQWSDPVAGRELRALGFDRPESLGTAFLADAPFLRRLTADTPPLDDDHPLRIAPGSVEGLAPLYWELLDAHGARQRFEASAWIEASWPAAWRERSLAAFAEQALSNRVYVVGFGAPRLSTVELAGLLTGSSLRSAVLVALRAGEPDIQAARQARERHVDDPFVEELLAADALGDRDYGRAADYLLAAERGNHAAELRPLRVLALGLAGRTAEARVALAGCSAGSPGELEWLARRFELN